MNVSGSNNWNFARVANGASKNHERAANGNAKTNNNNSAIHG